MKTLLVIMVLALASCTDTERARMAAMGNQHTVKVYSGGVLVAEYISTGRPSSPESSDSWQFKDAATGLLVEDLDPELMEFHGTDTDALISAVEAVLDADKEKQDGKR